MPIPRGGLGQWHSRTTFVLALAAGAAGLGSLWRFAWLMGTHGGAPFMLAYLLCLAGLAVPLLVAELALGIHGRGGPPQALAWAADRSLRLRHWRWLGWLACVAGLLVLVCQVVVMGWALDYANMLQAQQLSGASARLVGEQFAALLAQPERQMAWQVAFLLLLAAFAAQGVRRGVGLLAWLLVPALVTLLVSLVWLSLASGDTAAARDFLFSSRAMDFDRQALVAALGHALLTLGTGVGMGIVYGAYAPRRVPVARSVLAVAVFDTVVALLAALAIYPIALANNLEPAAGPGLLFISLPYAFGNMPQGEALGVLFFAMVVVAALGSAVALLEPTVAALRQRSGLPRAVVVAAVVSGTGAASAVVTYSLAGQGWFGHINLLALIDRFAAGLLLPAVCLVLALFVGWRLDRRVLREQFARESGLFFSLWHGLIRYIAPLALALLLLAFFLD